jgi:carboxyl-terminal processing protease
VEAAMILSRKIEKTMKKIKNKIITAAIVLLSFVWFGFAQDLFEVTKNLEVFNSLYKELNIAYVDDTDPGDLITVGIDAMLKSLDPYTVYIPESRMEDFRFMTTGQYGGIGSMIRKINDEIVIAEPYEGFAAAKAGLMAGDVILKVDNKSIAGMDQEEITTILKGESGTEVSIVVVRPGNNDTLLFKLKREEIKVPDVPYYAILKDSTGYIKLNSFTQTAYKEVHAAYRDLQTKGMNKLIFDLRGNGGGLLREAINIVNMFVPKGELIVETKGKNPDWDKEYKALNQPLDLDQPVIVLVDGGSASASEIVSGALQDLDRAVILGDTTYGKGLVQQTRELDYNAKLKVTVAKYYIPSGRSIQKLNYSNRNEEGQVEEVPDSLLLPYYTKKSRPVINGRGIIPDVEIKLPEFSKVAYALYVDNYIFNYATFYRISHDSIVNAADFSISDSEYDAFKSWLRTQDFSYTTDTEEYYNELIEASKEEKYYEDVATSLIALKDLIDEHKDEDLDKFKSEIIELLNNEIVSRYYFQTGRIENTLAKDPYILKSEEVFSSLEYKKILEGTN